MPGGTPHAQLSMGCGLQRCGHIQTRCLSEVPKPAGFSSKTKARHCCRGNRHKSNAGASVTRRKSGTDVGLVNIHLFSCSEKCQYRRCCSQPAPCFSDAHLRCRCHPGSSTQGSHGHSWGSAHPGGATRCPQLIPRPLLTWP